MIELLKINYTAASGLNLVVEAIILWNTVYIEKAIEYLRKTDQNFKEDLIKHLSPLGWEHINLTGDYIWSSVVHTMCHITLKYRFLCINT